MKKSVTVILFVLIHSQILAMTTGIITYVDGDVALNDYAINEKGTIVSIQDKDIVQSGSESRVIISLLDGSQIVLLNDTRLQFEFSEGTPSPTIRLLEGYLWVMINQAEHDYQIAVDDITASSTDVVLKVERAPEQKYGSIIVATNSAEIRSPGTSQRFNANSKIIIKDGGLIESTHDFDRIQMRSELSEYYLPKSGEVPIVIRTSLPITLAPEQEVPAIVISSSPILALDPPTTEFYQTEIELTVSAVDAGNADLYVITPPFSNHPGFEGVIPINVYRMKHSKVMKIKTSRGTLNIKLEPKEH